MSEMKRSAGFSALQHWLETITLKRCKRRAPAVCATLLVSICLGVSASGEKVLYQNDFSKGEVGKLPDEMLLLDGGFAVQDVAGNRVLQLPGAPLETFGVLFGPTESSGLAASARVH